MKKSLLELSEKLKDEDLITLSHLYLYRAMDVEQIFNYIYKIPNDTPGNKRKRTVVRKRLTESGLVTVSTYLPGKEALQITNKGIEIVRYTRDIPREVLDLDTKQAKRGYYTAADLAMKPRLINHQVHLNQIMLEFAEEARKIGLPWNYYDEKFLSQYHGIRPDGMITILDHDIFLEVDMATESRAQLIEKWEHYRSFVFSNEFKNKSRKILVIFDVDNIISKKNIEKRVALVRQTIIDTFLDQVTDNFEIVIKHQSQIMDYIFGSLLPTILNKNKNESRVLKYLTDEGWSLSYGYQLNQVLHGDFYNYFARKLDDNGQVIKFSGALQEYFLDFYLNGEMSVLHRIEFYHRNTTFYREKFGRDIRLVIATNDIESLYKDLNLIGDKVLGQPNIFVLDVNNFNSKTELFNNLYSLGRNGEVFAITSRDHSRREFKYRIGQKELINKKGRIKGVSKKSGQKK